MSFKKLVSAGCSFTQVPNTYENWPKHLSERLNLDPVYLGQGAASNGIIANKLIYNLEKELENNTKDELLVGVMWSGPDRHEIYYTGDFEHNNFNGSTDEKYRNPLKIVENYNWYLLNSKFTDTNSQVWFKYFHDDVGATINTIKNILMVQWYLKCKNIKYFMTTYAPHTLPNDLIKLEDVKAFYKLIDFKHFLPVNNALNWMMDCGKWHKNEEDGHPPTEANIEFVDKMIIPHLKNVGYID